MAESKSWKHKVAEKIFVLFLPIALKTCETEVMSPRGEDRTLLIATRCPNF